MFDQELVLKKLSLIETCLTELRTLAKPERIGSDIREERFISHTLQLAIQAALDAASHIVSANRLGEPKSYRELFDLLARAGWLSADLAQALRNMAGFRNILDTDTKISISTLWRTSSNINWATSNPLWRQFDVNSMIDKHRRNADCLPELHSPAPRFRIC